MHSSFCKSRVKKNFLFFLERYIAILFWSMRCECAWHRNYNFPTIKYKLPRRTWRHSHFCPTNFNKHSMFINSFSYYWSEKQIMLPKIEQRLGWAMLKSNVYTFSENSDYKWMTGRKHVFVFFKSLKSIYNSATNLTFLYFYIFLVLL